MVSIGRGSLFKREDGKIPCLTTKDLAEDNMFPFKIADTTFEKVSFALGDCHQVIEKWTGRQQVKI